MSLLKYLIIDGQIIKDASVKFREDVEIYIDGKVLEALPEMAIYHKPVGIQR